MDLETFLLLTLTVWFGVHKLWDDNEEPLIRLKRVGDRALALSPRLATIRAGWNCGTCASVWVAAALTRAFGGVDGTGEWFTAAMGIAGAAWAGQRLAAWLGFYDPDGGGSPLPDFSKTSPTDIRATVNAYWQRIKDLESVGTPAAVDYIRTLQTWIDFAEQTISETGEPNQTDAP